MYSNDFTARETVVCLHSSMSHGGQWRALANRLHGEFNVVTPNLLGYGGASHRFEQTRGAQDFINYRAGGDGWSFIPPEPQDRLVRLSSKVAAEFGALMAAGPAAKELAGLDVPLRLLCGTNTRQSAREISELLAGILPGVECHRLPGLAHMAPVTHSDDVNPLIIEHVLANATDEEFAVA